MSDARAKAEARRAKILARDSSKKVSAVTTEEEELLLSLTESKPKERPLAARRSYIQTKTEDSPVESDAAVTPVPSSSEKSPKEGTSAGSDKPQEKDETKEVTSQTKETAKKSESSEVTTSTSSTAIKFPPAKTLEEIEKEVAENTAKFDNKTLGKETDESKKKKIIQQKLAKVKGEKKFHLEANSVMRLIRLILIIFLGVFTGYQTMQTTHLQALQSTGGDSFLSNNVKSQILPVGSEFDEFGAPAASSNSFDSIPSDTSTSTTSNSNRTWVQYFQDYLRRNVECSVSAVGLVWWGSRMLNPVIHAQFKSKPQSTKPMDLVMNFVNNGIAGLIEGVYSIFGEIALHLFTIIATVTVLTIVYSHPDSVASFVSSFTTVASSAALANVGTAAETPNEL